MKIASLAAGLAALLLAGCANWADPNAAQNYELAARNASVTGEVQALGGYQVNGKDFVDELVNKPLIDGNRNWIFRPDRTYQVYSGSRVIETGRWSHYDGVFCRSIDRPRLRTCGTIWHAANVYRVTLSPRSNQLHLWALVEGRS